MSDNVPVTRADYDALSARVNWLENMLRDYLLRERETAILTFNHVETSLKLPRTKESRHK
jgi:hypothetical protein